MYTFKRNCKMIVPLGLTFSLLVSCFSAPTTEIPATTDQSASQEVDEPILYRLERDTNEEMSTPSPTPSIMLQPNVAGALDVGQGLLVPLVPVIDSNDHNNTTQITPVKASLLPVAVESVTGSTDEAKPEIRRSLEDMDVAEDIVFRPLFRYRQEEHQRYMRNRNYRPYIYAYKKPNYNDYDN